MKQTIKDMKLIDRPREKLIKLGHDSLSENELLAIIISTGTDKKNAIDLAEEILETFSEEALLEIEVEELTKINGIKEAKASKIIASLQLGKRIKENILNLSLIHIFFMSNSVLPAFELIINKIFLMIILFILYLSYNYIC